MFLIAMLMPGIITSTRAQQETHHSPAATNAAASAEPTFPVSGYHVDGNTVLPPEKLDFLTNYTGPAVSLARLRDGLGELQLLYRSA